MISEPLQCVGMVAFTAGITLGAALWFSGRYSAIDLSWIGLVPAVAGMDIGLRVRRRLNPDLFRRWFLAGLVLLGGYMLLREALRFVTPAIDVLVAMPVSA